MKNLEHLEQVALIKWASFQNIPHTNIKINDFLAAIPNGGNRNVITGSMLKSEGVKRGFPDLFFCYPKGKYHGLFIELKAPVKSARVSEFQKEWLSKLADVGYKTSVCYGFEQARQMILDYLCEV